MTPDPVASELRELEERERCVRAQRNAGLVSDRAAQLRLAQLEERRRQLRRGLAWSQERIGQVTLK